MPRVYNDSDATGSAGAHSHGIPNSGTHNHTISSGGSHNHGGTTGINNLPSPSVSYPPPGPQNWAENTHTHPIASDGSHSHGGTTGAGGDHNHGGTSGVGSHTHSISLDGNFHPVAVACKIIAT